MFPATDWLSNPNATYAKQNNRTKDTIAYSVQPERQIAVVNHVPLSGQRPGTAAGRALAPATTALCLMATAKAQSAAAVAWSVLLGGIMVAESCEHTK